MDEAVVSYPLNKISFEISSPKPMAKNGLEQVEIYIDKKPLVGILKDIEWPFAIRDGQKRIAGDYLGLSSDDVFLPSRHFLGEPKSQYTHDEKTAILRCRCGYGGCWPFLIKIDVGDRFVSWNGFEQPHRKDWSYDQLSTLWFDKTQYMKALSKAPRYFKAN